MCDSVKTVILKQKQTNKPWEPYCHKNLDAGLNISKIVLNAQVSLQEMETPKFQKQRSSNWGSELGPDGTAAPGARCWVLLPAWDLQEMGS